MAGGISVCYQPIVNALDGSIQGVEALARWQHPELGWISPAEFIPIAEETGLIHQLGEQLLRVVCPQARWWLDKGIRVQAAVNIYGKQLHNEKFIADVSPHFYHRNN